MTTNASQDYKQCPYCGLYHIGTCPKIESIEYHPNGVIKRITFHPTMQFEIKQEVSNDNT